MQPIHKPVLHSFNTVKNLPLWLVIVEYIVLMALLTPILNRIEEAESLGRTLLYIGVMVLGTTVFAIANIRFTRYLYKGCGLFFTEQSLIYRPSKLIYAEIKWTEIRTIESSKQTFTTYLLPIIRDPATIIAAQANSVGQYLMKANLKRYQTPILIEPNRFGASYYQLKTLIDERLKHEIPRKIVERTKHVDA